MEIMLSYAFVQVDWVIQNFKRLRYFGTYFRFIINNIPNLGHLSKQKTTDNFYGEKVDNTGCLILDCNKFIKRFEEKFTN